MEVTVIEILLSHFFQNRPNELSLYTSCYIYKIFKGGGAVFAKKFVALDIFVDGPYFDKSRIGRFEIKTMNSHEGFSISLISLSIISTIISF